ncbi:MAG: hypothetical protein AAF721_27815 [Myxococcota bacterium]
MSSAPHLVWPILAALASACASSDSKPKDKAKDKPGAAATAKVSTAKNEQALLRDYVEAFKAVASAGIPDDAEFARIGERAREAKSRNDVTDAFLGRFQSLLDVTRVLIRASSDPAAQANVARKLRALNEAINGPDATPLQGSTLSDAASLFAEEVVRLHMVTDASVTREQATALYFDGTL